MAVNQNLLHLIGTGIIPTKENTLNSPTRTTYSTPIASDTNLLGRPSYTVQKVTVPRTTTVAKKTTAPKTTTAKKTTVSSKKKKVTAKKKKDPIEDYSSIERKLRQPIQPQEYIQPPRYFQPPQYFQPPTNPEVVQRYANSNQAPNNRSFSSYNALGRYPEEIGDQNYPWFNKFLGRQVW